MPYIVNRYEDPQSLFDETGINAVVCVDEYALEQQLEVGDEVIAHPGVYSIIKGGFPDDTVVLPRGAGYCVIEYEEDLEAVTHNGEVVTYNGEPVTHSEIF